MPETQELKDFKKNHPWPDEAGIDSLFRFYKFNEDHVDYLSHLFVDAKIYHTLPAQFNDPFECKPHFNWPKSAAKVLAIRQHLIKVERQHGHTKKEAESKVSRIMGNREILQDTIYNVLQKNYGELRICSFTTQKENLLFWSHYADSHKGFCVEFDATKMPIVYAYKVQYQEEYPEVVYPTPRDARVFIPALIKSKIWEYEQEFRTIFVPEAVRQPVNDGESLLLNGDVIKNIYFGASINDTNKKRLLDLVNKGPFRPGIWNTNLSKSSFSLEFSQCN